MSAFAPLHRRRGERRAVLLLVLLTLTVACGNASGERTALPAATVRITSVPPAPVVTQPVTESATAGPELPSDLSLLTLTNKLRSLGTWAPSDLAPIPRGYVSSARAEQLRRPAEEALVSMLSAAKSEGLAIKVNSAYRSYDYQVSVFRSEVATYGCSQALRESAVPGHSEHQLGLAVDLTSADVGWGLVDAFAQTAEGRWLASHATRFGFVLSYPQGKESVTGYIYEPWHYRYVTLPIAQAIEASGETPTEFLEALGSASMLNIVAPIASATPGLSACVDG